MHLELIKAFASALGSRFGGKLFELLSEQDRLIRSIDEKVNAIYGEVLQLGLQQRLAPYSARRQKIAADVANFDDLLRAPQGPSTADLDNIETRYIRTRHDSYYFAVSDFVRELVGVELGQGILRDSFVAKPEQFQLGAIHKYSSILTRKGELPLETYLDHMATFAASLLHDLEVLSSAYIKGHALLSKHGRLASSAPRAEILDRWLRELGLARDVAPLLGECVRHVASPAVELGEISGHPARKRAASLVFQFEDWILENKPKPFFFKSMDDHKPYTGYKSLYDTGRPHVTSAIDYHWWELESSLSETPGAISLRAGSSDNKYLCLDEESATCWIRRAADRVPSRMSWAVVVCATSESDATPRCALRSVENDRWLAAGRHFIFDMVDVVARSEGPLVNEPRSPLRVLFWQDRLYAGGFLRVGESLTSLTARHQFRFEAARGLVVSEKDQPDRILWGPPAGVSIGPHWRLYVGDDGLHIFASSRALVDHLRAASAAPASGTQPLTNSDRTQVLIMQDDGNLVFYDCNGSSMTALAMKDANHPIPVHAPSAVELAA